MWWDEARIQATVTRQFVCSHLLPEEIERLDRPLAFGGGLTDGTYWEWIEGKAKRIFLVLVDLGMPDQIFGIIDDSWDDGDLPIALDQVERLELKAARDERCDRKFYYRQFHYLLKPLRKGEHTVYQDTEVVPINVVDRRASVGVVSAVSAVGVGGSGAHSAEKVTLPGCPNKVFCRRRIPIGSGPSCLSHEDFQCEINSIRHVQNEHLVSYFCSYVHQGCGYVLFTPASDASLKTLLATPPTFVKSLDKESRRTQVANWIHCLVDTMCFLHSRGLSHGNVRPSTVLLNSDNHIFFADFTRLDADRLLAGSPDSRTSFDKEAYDYAAPEQWFRPSSASPLGPGASLIRKGTLTSPLTPPTLSGAVGGGGGGGFGGDNHAHVFSISRGGADHHPASPTAMMHAPNPHLNPQAADVFSLGCIILELLGFLMKRQTRAFAAHRAARHKTPGRGGAVLDSSFHRNLGQVEGWMTGLARDAKKKARDSKGPASAVFRGATPMLHVVERMLALHPSERPSIHEVQTRMYQILTESCGIAEPHCVHAPHYGGWAYSGLGSLKMARPPLSSAPPGPGGGTASGPGGGAGGGVTTAAAEDDDADETMSIATSKRSSGQSIRQHFHHHSFHQYQRHFQHSRSSSVGTARVSSAASAILERRDTLQWDGDRARDREWDSERDRDREWGRERDLPPSSPSPPPPPRRETASTAPATPRETRTSFELGSGLQAIRDLRIRDKVRPPWQQAAPASPAFSGVSVG